MKPKPNQEIGVQTLYTIRQRLKTLNKTFGMSWRQISHLDEYSGISHATLSAIARGRDPKDNEVRRKLGLPEINEVETIRDDEGNTWMKLR